MITVPIAMFGFTVVVLALFALLPSTRALVAGAVAGSLLLPNYAFIVSGLPQYNKSAAISASLLLATILFDSRRLMAFRFRLADVPMLTWVLCPIATSVTNDLGVKDGFYVSLGQWLTWGIPYFLGRVHLTRWEALREMALGVFIGGLFYIPFCALEMVIAPQIHMRVYGYDPFEIYDMVRLGGYRPVVFFSSGLECGLFMTAATLMGVWLWRTKSVRTLFGAPVGYLVAGLALTTVMCRSLGALTLLALGLGMLSLCRTLRSAMPMLLLLAPAVFYISERATDPNGGAFLVDMAAMIDHDRAESLRFRMVNEDMLVQRALESPMFGWGGWGRSRIYNDQGKDISITDSLWIIAVGMHGIVGLVSIFGALLAPIVVMTRRVRWVHWAGPVCGGGAALAVMSALFATDCLINNMPTPIYMIAGGGVVSAALAGAAAWRPPGASLMPRRGVPAVR